MAYEMKEMTDVWSPGLIAGNPSKYLREAYNPVIKEIGKALDFLRSAQGFNASDAKSAALYENALSRLLNLEWAGFKVPAYIELDNGLTPKTVSIPILVGHQGTIDGDLLWVPPHYWNILSEKVKAKLAMEIESSANPLKLGSGRVFIPPSDYKSITKTLERAEEWERNREYAVRILEECKSANKPARSELGPKESRDPDKPSLVDAALEKQIEEIYKKSERLQLQRV